MVPAQLVTLGSQWNRPRYLAPMAALSLVALALRFVHPLADFPEGITSSGAPLTDEGWYASAATRLELRGTWYEEGDFNPAVVAPAWPLLLGSLFAVTGVSLQAARWLSACLAALLCFLLFRAAASSDQGAAPRPSRPDVLAGALAVGGYALNYHAYAFSRVALLELPMTLWIAVCGWLLLGAKDAPLFWVRALLAGVAAALAVATKSSALFVLPLGLFFCGYGARSGRLHWIALLAFLTGASVILLPLAVLVTTYWQDAAQFIQWNLAERTGGPFRIFAQYFTLLKKMVTTWPLQVAVFVAVLTLRTRWEPGWWRRPWPSFCIGWLGLYSLTLGMGAYLPPRYLQPMLWPMMVLVGSSLAPLLLAGVRGARPVGALFACALLLGGVRIGKHVLSPSYSLIAALDEVAHEVRTRAGLGAVVMGNSADMVELRAGTHSMNDYYSVAPLGARLGRQPTFWLVESPAEPEVRALVHARYAITLLSEWRVMNDYRKRPLRLYQLTPR